MNLYYDYNVRIYSGKESSENRRARMNEMFKRLLWFQDVPSLEECMAGRQTSSLGSAQRQLDMAMNQLKDIQENGKNISNLEKDLHDLEKAQNQ